MDVLLLLVVAEKETGPALAEPMQGTRMMIVQQSGFQDRGCMMNFGYREHAVSLCTTR